MDTAVPVPSAYAFVEGIRHTRRTLEAWQLRPWSVLRPWVLGSLAASPYPPRRS